MFCLLADIEIRTLTDYRKSLQDPLRGILKEGYSMQTGTTAMQVFKSGDAATGVPVLVSLYNKMRADPLAVDRLTFIIAGLNSRRREDWTRFRYP